MVFKDEMKQIIQSFKGNSLVAIYLLMDLIGELKPGCFLVDREKRTIINVLLFSL